MTSDLAKCFEWTFKQKRKGNGFVSKLLVPEMAMTHAISIFRRFSMWKMMKCWDNPMRSPIVASREAQRIQEPKTDVNCAVEADILTIAVFRIWKLGKAKGASPFEGFEGFEVPVFFSFFWMRLTWNFRKMTGNSTGSQGFPQGFGRRSSPSSPRTYRAGRVAWSSGAPPVHLGARMGRMGRAAPGQRSPERRRISRRGLRFFEMLMRYDEIIIDYLIIDGLWWYVSMNLFWCYNMLYVFDVGCCGCSRSLHETFGRYAFWWMIQDAASAAVANSAVQWLKIWGWVNTYGIIFGGWTSI